MIILHLNKKNSQHDQRNTVFRCNKFYNYADISSDCTGPAYTADMCLTLSINPFVLNRLSCCRFSGWFHPLKRISICTSSGFCPENNRMFSLAIKWKSAAVLTWEKEIHSWFLPVRSAQNAVFPFLVYFLSFCFQVHITSMYVLFLNLCLRFCCPVYIPDRNPAALISQCWFSWHYDVSMI